MEGSSMRDGAYFRVRRCQASDAALGENSERGPRAQEEGGDEIIVAARWCRWRPRRSRGRPRRSRREHPTRRGA